MKSESLHNHTLDSDGIQTHLEMLEGAAECGVDVIAFTDHDRLPSQKVLRQLRDYDGPTAWTVGIEMTAAAPAEADRPAPLHILGLFIDPLHRALLEYCVELKDSRITRMKRMVAHLTTLGFDLSEADCMAAAGDSIVGSPHIVKAIESKPQNRLRIEQLLQEMKVAATHDSTINFRYERMMEEGPRQYPYVLFMKSSSFKPMPPSETQRLLNLDESVKLIRDAGGLALVAHWFFEKKKLPPALLEKLATEKRIDGVETEVINLITQRDVDADVAYLQQLAATHNLATTIGADAHDAEDLAFFAKSTAGERSVGQLDRLIERYQPNLTWTSKRNAAV